MKTYAFFFTLFFILITVSYVTSEPGFNGTTPGCSGSGCHTFQTGIVTAAVLVNNQIQITLTGNTGNVAGELVNSSGTVVAVNNGTSSNPFILTAPSAGNYTVNAGYKSPSRVYGTATANIIPPPPAAPSNLSALVNQNPLSVSLQWNDNSSNEDGFIIERETLTEAFSPIDTVNAGTTAFQDLNVAVTTYRYRVQAYNAGGGSTYSNIAEIFVPVELINFSAAAIPGKVTLNWETVTEIDNQGFIIERKSSGSAEWSRAGYVDGKGTTTEKTFYSFYDVPSASGHYFYRLKQLDYNGTFEYSNEVDVDYHTPQGFSLSQNYPNPFNPSTSIKFSIPQENTVSIVIYNVLGKEISTLLNEQRPAGTYSITFDASSLPSGLYFYKLSAGKFEQTRKMLLIK